MMLVYHFKGRIAILEQKCDTMFDIMNNMVKEMRMIKMQTRMNNETIIFNDRMPVNRFSQFEEVEEDDEEEDDEEDDEEEVDVVISNKIIVSDDEDDDDVKIITIDLDDNEIECEAEVDNEAEVEAEGDNEVDVEVEVETLDNLEEIQDIQDIQEIQEVYESDEQIISVNKLETETIEVDESLVKPEPIDYKKLDITYLRTMVITRGLSTDTKKLKKNDLVKLLEQNE
jgi:hypothetical protein